MHDIGNSIIWWGGVLVAFAAIIETIRRGLRRTKRWLVAEIAAPVQETRENAAAVAAEVSHNGGSSMKDALARIERGQVDLAADVRTQAARLDDHLRFPHTH